MTVAIPIKAAIIVKVTGDTGVVAEHANSDKILKNYKVCNEDGIMFVLLITVDVMEEAVNKAVSDQDSNIAKNKLDRLRLHMDRP